MGTYVPQSALRRDDNYYHAMATHLQGPFEEWRARVHKLIDATPFGDDSHANYVANAWWIGPVVFSDTVTRFIAANHSAAHIHDTGAFVFVYRITHGEAWVETRHHAFKHKVGDFLCVDYARPISMLNFDVRTQAVLVPHPMLGLPPGEPINNRLISGDSVQGQLLHQEWDRVFASLTAGDTRVHRDTVGRILACLQLAIEPNADTVDKRQLLKRAMFERIQRDIELNLHNPELGTDWLLKRYGISRAGLYRMFESLGGVRTFIRDRRVVRAILQIAHAPQERGIVSRAAEDWGFSSNVQFTRMAKDLVGIAPGSLFSQPIAPPSSKDVSRVLNGVKDWAEQA